MKSNNDEWRYFYKLIKNLHDLINIESCTVLYQNKESAITSLGSIEPNYRAVIQLSKSHDIRLVTDSIEAIHKEYRNLVDDEDKPIPKYIPELLVNTALEKIQIHENIAHSSKKYEKDSQIPISLWPLSAIIGEEEEVTQNRKLIATMIKDLKKNGYEPIINRHLGYTELCVNTNTLLDKFKCKSVQHRRRTGKQIRANFFTSKDGYLEKSKLRSVGVLIIPNNTKVQVFKSAKRKIRSDAIYHSKQNNEIQLKEVPLSFRYGKHYAK